jgi:hypothetical protein
LKTQYQKIFVFFALISLIIQTFCITKKENISKFTYFVPQSNNFYTFQQKNHLVEILGNKIDSCAGSYSKNITKLMEINIESCKKSFGCAPCNGKRCGKRCNRIINPEFNAATCQKKKESKNNEILKIQSKNYNNCRKERKLLNKVQLCYRKFEDLIFNLELKMFEKYGNICSYSHYYDYNDMLCKEFNKKINSVYKKGDQICSKISPIIKPKPTPKVPIKPKPTPKVPIDDFEELIKMIENYL